MFLSVFSRIGIIFTILAIGALARWRKILTQDTTDGLCRVAIELTLPFLYFYSLSTNLNWELFTSIWYLPVLAIILTLLSYFLTHLICWRLKLKLDERNTFLFLGTFTNYGFLAIPLVYALFGEEALVKLIMFNFGITFMYWTFGVALLSASQPKKTSVFKNLINNGTIALMLGLLVGISSIKLPEFIAESAKFVGSASIPLALIVIGSLLARKGKKTVSPKTISALVLCRLILIPGIVVLILHYFTELPKIVIAIIMVQAATPSASTTPILTKRFGGDAELAASGVFFTTLFSIFTLPLFLSLVLQ